MASVSTQNRPDKFGWQNDKYDGKAKDLETFPNHDVPLSLKVLKKVGNKLGPIVSDWPENRQSERLGLAKRAGWNQYRKGNITFSSLGSTLQLKVMKSGQLIGNVVMGGRLSTEPLVHDGKAYFGSKDGYVYCYDLEKQTLAWRFLAAPRDERIMYASQLESHWPVTKVELNGQNLRVIAGRHAEIGGYFSYDISPTNGEIVSKQFSEPKGWQYVTRPNIARDVKLAPSRFFENEGAFRSEQEHDNLVEKNLLRNSKQIKSIDLKGRRFREEKISIEEVRKNGFGGMTMEFYDQQ